MGEATPYQLLADLVLALHLLVVVFVVVGLVLVLAGNLLGWHWVNALWFRLAHLLAIGIVCPLTSIENWLRRQARATAYEGGFIEHWFQRLLFYDAPSWVFTLGYTLFALAVVASWWCFPPRPRR